MKKKLFAALIAFTLVFAGCDDDDGGNDEMPPSPRTTTLKINNQSFTEITDVVWNSVSFDVSQTDKSIKTGSGVQKNVQAGSGYIYFKRKTNPINARTNNVVIIEKNENIEFVLNDNTIIVDVDNPYRSGTFSALQPLFTTLKIKNESLVEITDVSWNNVTFTAGQSSIKTGTSITKAVQAGSGYIYFKRQGNPIAARTNVSVVVEKDKEEEFVFINNTIIAEVSNPSNNEILETFYTKPWILVKQNTITITQYGEYNFGNILVGAEKDITFTIENIGGANLVFENVNGSRVNLEENISGYFSIIQQPLAASVIPGDTTAFTIRFNPTATGNNYSATVKTTTNSHNNNEFSFRVKGNARSYAIGDTGPGGGIIFFAQSGQYKECSGELGSYPWANAITVASNYRGGNFTNWRLPDRGELRLMYENLYSKNLGGFYSGGYWSSVEYNSNIAYDFIFINNNGISGEQITYKTDSCRVRAVRSFSL
jgi:hypothetical protein